MPPQILNALPKLPEELEYRFIGTADPVQFTTRTSSSTTSIGPCPVSDCHAPTLFRLVLVLT